MIKNLALLLLTLSLLAGLFWWMKPAPLAPPAPTAVPRPQPLVAATTEAVPSPVVPAEQRVDLRIKAGRLHSGPELIRVTEGTVLILQLLSDQADELHLHGYDLSLPLQPGRPAELRFTADRSGRFVYELHAAHRSIGALEVLPQ